ncbi:MAG: phytoene/squalene synthase family protein [Bacteroidota bacterium]
MKAIYDRVSAACCKITTQAYTSSFALGIKLLHKEYHSPIYAIYSFFRLGDEIVDTFHDYPKAALLTQFQTDTYQAIQDKISLNPILNAFQQVVHTFQIDLALVQAFFESMEMDLNQKTHDQASFEKYLLGSSEVVGLMCLKVFCKKEEYTRLKPYAMRLGQAFQKVNFLRDLRADAQQLGRYYFPGGSFEQFNDTAKRALEADIAADFEAALVGIKQLPDSARLGVYAAYTYYRRLLHKIGKTSAQKLLKTRVRIPNYRKYAMMGGVWLRYKLNRI